MGRLYVAEQGGIEGFAKIVALKQILPHLADSPEFRRMFLTEARVAARLDHPNIVATYELGEVDGIYFIAMEYLPGEDLGAVLARCRTGGPMPIEIAATVAHQASSGLQYAHEIRDSSNRLTGLVHRDVNPSNIFLTYHGVVKLLDFGVAKGGTTGATSPGLFKGKYGYCAPEQLDSETVDRRTDVFCVGIVLWECLTGRRLFVGNTDAAIIDAVRSGPILPPSSFRPEIPAELDDLTMRALHRDPTRRFQSAFELCEALDRFLATRPSKPTSNTIGRWLETLFGIQRAVLKRAIGQGREIERALDHLASMADLEALPGRASGAASAVPSGPKSRAMWSTNLRRPDAGVGAVPRRETSEQDTADEHPRHLHDDPTSRYDIPPELAEAMSRVTPGPRLEPVRSRPPAVAPARSGGGHSFKVITLIGVLGAAVMTIATLREGDAPAVSRASGPGMISAAIELRSDPPGAHVLVDGEPTGLLTPTTLRDLRPGRTLEVRLDRDGYQTAVQTITVDGKHTGSHDFTLVPASGTLRLEGLPMNASVYIDDVLVDVRGPLQLPLGERRLRVEHRGAVLFEQTVTARPGEQAIQIGRGRRGR
jgi:serine/threonine protein kinase